MEIVIKLSSADLKALAKDGVIAVHTNLSEDETPAPAKRGRPPKKAAEVEETEEDDEEETEEETPAPKKRGRPPKKVEEAEETEEDEDEEETEEDDEEAEEVEEDEPEYVEGDDLTKLKKALTAFSKAKGSKDAAVKVLRKFAPSSEKVKVGDLKALLKALKV